MREIANYEIERVMLGQVFYDDGLKIEVKQCWMVECVVNTSLFKSGDPEENEDMDEELANDCCDDQDWFLVPILPTVAEREFFIEHRDECWIDSEFLTRQNGVFSAYDTPAKMFFESLPEFSHETDLKTVFKMIKDRVKDRSLAPLDDYGEPYPRHLYLATTPKGQILYLEFDDNCYRPEMRVATMNKSVAEYYDFVETARGWRRLRSDRVEAFFARISDATINALNDGLDGLRKIRQEALPVNGTAKKAYRLFDHITEVQAVPTLWRNATTEVSMFYDVFGGWRIDTEGNAQLDLEELTLKHAPMSDGRGGICLREAKTALP